ncbi:SRPBCC domain-containing protein [Gulosibacter faecalis]|jgi:uncharacterized protein YndB with AHSA1/START domain|uniref:SRPBCC domain-containing protein n=1 Tax=Gulosibacter faecalis TaxID=272240 RepID=A0ABW5UW61_9MICO|nr:SRPBCC domain-containing protein [Gulosibacter faecalis]
MAEIIGKIGRESDGYRVVFEIDSRFSRREIWRAISDRTALASWLGKFSHDLAKGTAFTVEYLNDNDYRIEGEVLENSTLRTLDYTWKFGDYPASNVRFDLENGLISGTRVRLTVSGLDNADVVRAAATWHAQLEFLRSRLNHAEVPAYALRFRRDELVEPYRLQVERLGSEPDATNTVTPSRPARNNPMVSVLHSHAYLA